MIYIKTNQLKWLFSVAFTLFFLSFGYAQKDNSDSRENDEKIQLIKICNSGNWSEAPTQNNSPCLDNTVWGTNLPGVTDIVEILITAYAVEIPGATPDSKVENSFPELYLPPYLKYEYSPGVFKYTEELNNWVFIKYLDGKDGNLYALYSASKLVDVLLPEDANCEFATSTIKFPIEMGLATFSNKITTPDYIDYPIMAHGAADDIFSCQIFNDTKLICDPNADIEDLDNSVVICIPCNLIEDANDPESRTNSGNVSELTVLSNPFSESLEFNFNSKMNTKLLMTLHDSDGRLVQKQTLNAYKGENNFHSSAESYSSGIYYLTIISGEKKFIKKVVCIK